MPQITPASSQKPPLSATPILETLMKNVRTISMFLLVGGLCWAQNRPGPDLPDAPQPHFLVQPENEVRTTSSFHPPVKVWNKKFTIAHAAYLGSIVYDAEVTHQGLAHHKCLEKNGGNPLPSRGQLYRKDLGLFALSTGFDWFMARSKIPYIPYILPVAGTAEHIHGGTQWFTDGCY